MYSPDPDQDQNPENMFCLSLILNEIQQIFPSFLAGSRQAALASFRKLPAFFRVEWMSAAAAVVKRKREREQKYAKVVIPPIGGKSLFA